MFKPISFAFSTRSASMRIITFFFTATTNYDLHRNSMQINLYS